MQFERSNTLSENGCVVSSKLIVPQNKTFLPIETNAGYLSLYLYRRVPKSSLYNRIFLSASGSSNTDRN